ncbi:DoxX family protein [Pedobacter sp.]
MKQKNQEQEKNNIMKAGNATKIIYYATTGIISMMMVFIGFRTLSNPEVKVGMQQLGFSADFFRVELGITKLIGALLLWLPIRLLKEFAYFGFAITFGSAALAHLCAGDPASKTMVAIVFLIILIVSYISSYKLQAKK